jgi:hypothetical protein
MPSSTTHTWLREVSEALEQGRKVIRLVLSPEADGQLVTLFAN